MLFNPQSSVLNVCARLRSEDFNRAKRVIIGWRSFVDDDMISSMVVFFFLFISFVLLVAFLHVCFLSVHAHFCLAAKIADFIRANSDQQYPYSHQCSYEFDLVNRSFGGLRASCMQTLRDSPMQNFQTRRVWQRRVKTQILKEMLRTIIVDCLMWNPL